jgi:YbbR domain-containing protein
LKNWLASLGRHKGLKLLSLLLALALWFAVSGEERTETTLSLALELVNTPATLVITSEVPPNLQVRVSGPRSIINKLSQTRLTQTIDLAGYKSGQHPYYFGPNSFSFPRGVQVARITPNPINLTLATSMTRTLSIKPALEGSPPEGYEVLEAKTRPEKVVVKGPATELQDLKYLSTLPIDVSYLTEHTVISTDLDFKNLHLSLKEQVPILADVSIIAKPLTRTISGALVEAVPGPARLKPAQVTLTLKGPWRQVKNLKATDLKVTVDTKDLSPGRHRLNVSVSLPNGLNLVQVQPATVTATVEKSR